MTTYTIDQRELLSALEQFEMALNTPIVSGELEGWTAAAQWSWQEAERTIERQLDAHRDQLKEIGRQDPELLPRVAQMKQEDSQIEDQLQDLATRIERLGAKAPRIEPNEGKAQDDLDRLTAQGIAFVQRVRKQEATLQTWFSEAFNRDLGVGD